MTLARSISFRIAATTVAIVAVIAAIVLTRSVQLYRHDAEAMLAAKASAFTSVAVATKHHVAKLHELGTFRNEDLVAEAKQELAKGKSYRDTRLFPAIPVVAGWTSAREAAQRENIDFRISAFDARNDDNDPRNDTQAGPFRTQLLTELTAQVDGGGAESLSRIDRTTNRLHFLRAIRLEQSCMQCHGDPATSPTGDGKDVTGHTMENWRPGMVHGAFEVVMPMDECDAHIASFLLGALGWTAPTCALALGLFWWLLHRTLRTPLAKLATRLRDMAEGEGDLTKRLALPRTDEVGEVGHWFDRFANRVHDTVAAARALATDVDGGAKAIAKESHRLAQGASTSAATIQEINANLVEINAQAERTATSCEAANDAAGRARQAVQRGTAEVRRLDEAMAAIQESSQAVTRVVSVIQDVSFQTNLLALNAAVEAARAGDAGRGFAVVADEVRNLAQRSAKAATETSQLIEQARQRASTGVRLTSEVGTVLGAIDDETGKVGEVLGGTAEAARQQRQSVQQVATGINELGTTTQNNAASAEELAVTSSQSSDQIGRLQRLMAAFRVAQPAATAAPSVDATD